MYLSFIKENTNRIYEIKFHKTLEAEMVKQFDKFK